jgi:dTDP-glucose 4,6-dehydratase
MPRMLVTGGAGFIGATFVHRVVRTEPSWRVTVVDSLTYAGRRDNLAPVAGLCAFVEGDITDRRQMDRLVADADLVVHFAAESHVDRSLGEPEPFVRTNVLGTFSVLEAVRRHGRRLHHVSTDEVFGDLGPDDPPFTEETAYRPSSPYSATKAAADHLVRAWVRSYGVLATISNCANNYGPYQHVEKFIPRQITNVLTGGRPKLYGTGDNIREWTHVDDHNDAVYRIATEGRPGETYLVGSGDERSNLEIVRLVLELMGRPTDEYDLVADRPGHDRRYANDSAKLRRELGWRPRYGNLSAGLAATIRWYRDNPAWWEPIKAAAERRYLAAPPDRAGEPRRQRAKSS